MEFIMSNAQDRQWDKVKSMSTNSSRDFHVALRFRKRGDKTGEYDEFVGYDRTFTEKEARVEQQRIISSPTYRSEEAGSLGVVVMHWRTWKRCIKDGKASTLNRVEQNMKMYGTGLCSVSTLAKRVDNCGHLVRS
jgi:hypothetical protein